MGKIHIDSEFNCYELLKFLEDIVIKDKISLNDVSIGISIDDCCLDVCRVANGISLRSNGKGDYLLVFRYKEQ